MTLQFYLGAAQPAWLAVSPVPLFVNNRVLFERKTFPRALVPWALDSGAFSELKLFGRWVTTPRDYVASVRRYQSEIGQLAFPCQQDWMCEPPMLAKTGLRVSDHQRMTIDNYLSLRELAPDIAWVPVVQGWTLYDYALHMEQWDARGVDLFTLPRVGVGSVCKRGAVSASLVLHQLVRDGLTRLHGFGLKIQALTLAGGLLESADSQSWSFGARAENRRLAGYPGAPKTGEQNNLDYALYWYGAKIEPILEAGFDDLGAKRTYRATPVRPSSLARFDAARTVPRVRLAKPPKPPKPPKAGYRKVTPEDIAELLGRFATTLGLPPPNLRPLDASLGAIASEFPHVRIKKERPHHEARQSA